MACRMLPVPLTWRYSGSERPAWRMNHTGVRPAGSLRHARRKGASGLTTGPSYAVPPTPPQEPLSRPPGDTGKLLVDTGCRADDDVAHEDTRRRRPGRGEHPGAGR